MVQEEEAIVILLLQQSHGRGFLSLADMAGQNPFTGKCIDKCWFGQMKRR
jgi:hypothetical protein